MSFGTQCKNWWKMRTKNHNKNKIKHKINKEVNYRKIKRIMNVDKKKQDCNRETRTKE